MNSSVHSIDTAAANGLPPARRESLPAILDRSSYEAPAEANIDSSHSRCYTLSILPRRAHRHNSLSIGSYRSRKRENFSALRSFLPTVSFGVQPASRPISTAEPLMAPRHPQHHRSSGVRVSYRTYCRAGYIFLGSCSIVERRLYVSRQSIRMGSFGDFCGKVHCCS